MVKRTRDLGAGDLRHKVRFEKRADVADDGYGNTQGDWQQQFTRRAYIGMTQGGEQVIASRLEGVQPAVVVVRYDSRTATVTPDWRLVEVRGDGTERVYGIRTAEDMDHDRRWITLLCIAGVAP